MQPDTCSRSLPVEAVWPWAYSSTRVDRRLVLLGSWAIAALAQVRIPVSPIPITGQTLGVLLVGALRGSRQGPLSVIIHLAQGVIGLPVFAGGTTGIAALTGPRGGYLVGFVVAALLVSWLSERGWGRQSATAAAPMLLGNVCIYALGLPWLASFTGYQAALRHGLICFIPGDPLKLLLAATIASSGWLVLLHRGGDRR